MGHALDDDDDDDHPVTNARNIFTVYDSPELLQTHALTGVGDNRRWR